METQNSPFLSLFQVGTGMSSTGRPGDKVGGGGGYTAQYEQDGGNEHQETRLLSTESTEGSMGRYYLMRARFRLLMM